MSSTILDGARPDSPILPQPIYDRTNFSNRRGVVRIDRDAAVRERTISEELRSALEEQRERQELLRKEKEKQEQEDEENGQSRLEKQIAQFTDFSKMELKKKRHYDECNHHEQHDDEIPQKLRQELNLPLEM